MKLFRLFKREKQDNLELEQLIKAQNSRIKQLENQMIDLEASFDIVRDKVLRRFQSKRNPKEEEETSDKPLDGLPRL